MAATPSPAGSRTTSTERVRRKRLLQLLFGLLTARGPRRSDRLLQDSGTSRATLYRDLQRLRECGINVVTERRNGTSWVFVPRPDERQSLAGVLDLLAAARKQFSAGATVSPARDVPRQVANAVDSAIERGRRLVLFYRKVDGPASPTEYLVEPQFLYVRDGDVYLDAWKLGDGAPVHRRFKLCRCVSASVTTRACAEPPLPRDQVLAHVMKAYGGERVAIVVRLHPPAANLADEYAFAPDQRVTRNDDGTVDVHATVAGTKEALTHALSFRAQAEVLTPPEARDEMLRLLRGMLARYESRVPSHPVG